jgi:hypothetical protein
MRLEIAKIGNPGNSKAGIKHRKQQNLPPGTTPIPYFVYPGRERIRISVAVTYIWMGETFLKI